MVFLVAGLGCAGKVTTVSAPTPPATTASPEGERLAALIKDYTESAKRLDPFWAPALDLEEGLDQFGDYPSEAYFKRERALTEATVAKVREIRQGDLTPSEARMLMLFQGDIEKSAASYRFPYELLDFHQMRNRLRSYLDDSSPNLTSFPFDSVAHYEAFLKRSEGFPAYIDRQIALLRRGIREHVMLSCDVAVRVPETYKEGLEPDGEKHVFGRPVSAFPASFGAADRERLTLGFRAATRERIRPGIAKFDAFFRSEYLPKCRKSYGLAGLPNADAWYRNAIQGRVDLALDPKELHAFGLKEVERIERDIDVIRRELGDKGARRAFIRSISRDPKYMFQTKQELLSAFSDVRASIEAALPSFFTLIPKTPYKVVESENPVEAAASYREPTDNQPFGRFIVAVANLRSVPKYEVTTLSLHEAIPGHHFQLAIQYEAKERLSEYQRKMFFSNAFAEGWALYSEWLGNEMGLFKDPLQRLGNRNDDMMRAVRLVVDTGIHALGWSRSRALDYMRARLAMDDDTIQKELDRYAAWPAQALSYKVGQRKILELRRLAEKGLGNRFDVREFHRAVLENGSVSLQVLDAQVRGWIAAVKAQKN